MSGDWAWRAAFLSAAIVAPALLRALSGYDVGFVSPVPMPWIVISGLIVGVGVFLASGCTSGHGICGMARLSPRSIAATVTFMVAAVPRSSPSVTSWEASDAAHGARRHFRPDLRYGHCHFRMANPAKVLNFFDVVGTCLVA